MSSSNRKDATVFFSPQISQQGQVHRVSSQIKNTEKIVTSQSVQGGTLSTIFGEPMTPRRATRWGHMNTHASFLKYLEKLKADNMQIYFLSCDDNFGFGVFAKEDFGCDQKETWYGPNCKFANATGCIRTYWDRCYKIPACGARNSTFYFVMTPRAEGYKGKHQVCFTRSTWADTEKEMSRKYKKNKIITCICYSTGKEQYLVVMTEKNESQNYRWMTGDDKDQKWENEEKANSRFPKIIFKSPMDGRLLLVATSDTSDTWDSSYEWEWDEEERFDLI